MRRLHLFFPAFLSLHHLGRVRAGDVCERHATVTTTVTFTAQCSSTFLTYPLPHDGGSTTPSDGEISAPGTEVTVTSSLPPLSDSEPPDDGGFPTTAPSSSSSSSSPSPPSVSNSGPGSPSSVSLYPPGSSTDWQSEAPGSPTTLPSESDLPPGQLPTGLPTGSLPAPTGTKGDTSSPPSQAPLPSYTTGPHSWPGPGSTDSASPPSGSPSSPGSQPTPPLPTDPAVSTGSVPSGSLSYSPTGSQSNSEHPGGSSSLGTQSWPGSLPPGSETGSSPETQSTHDSLTTIPGASPTPPASTTSDSDQSQSPSAPGSSTDSESAPPSESGSAPPLETETNPPEPSLPDMTESSPGQPATGSETTVPSETDPSATSSHLDTTDPPVTGSETDPEPTAPVETRSSTPPPGTTGLPSTTDSEPTAPAETDPSISSRPDTTESPPAGSETDPEATEPSETNSATSPTGPPPELTTSSETTAPSVTSQLDTTEPPPTGSETDPEATEPSETDPSATSPPVITEPPPEQSTASEPNASPTDPSESQPGDTDTPGPLPIITPSSISLSSTSTLPGVSSNTLIETTDEEGHHTTIPYFWDCWFCGGGGVLAWGLGPRPGIYPPPPQPPFPRWPTITIGHDNIPTPGPEPEASPSATQPRPTETTEGASETASITTSSTPTTTECSASTVTNSFVSCVAISSGAEPSSCTTSTEVVTGCEATETASTTVAACISPVFPNNYWETLPPLPTTGYDLSETTTSPTSTEPPTEPTSTPACNPTGPAVPREHLADIISDFCTFNGRMEDVFPLGGGESYDKGFKVSNKDVVLQITAPAETCEVLGEVSTQTCKKWFNEIVDGCASDEFHGGRIHATRCSSFSIDITELPPQPEPTCNPTGPAVPKENLSDIISDFCTFNGRMEDVFPLGGGQFYDKEYQVNNKNVVLQVTAPAETCEVLGGVLTQACEKWLDKVVDGCASDDTFEFHGGNILANSCLSLSIDIAELPPQPKPTCNPNGPTVPKENLADIISDFCTFNGRMEDVFPLGGGESYEKGFKVSNKDVVLQITSPAETCEVLGEVSTQTCEKWFNEIVDGCASDEFHGGRIHATRCSSFSIDITELPPQPEPTCNPTGPAVPKENLSDIISDFCTFNGRMEDVFPLGGGESYEKEYEDVGLQITAPAETCEVLGGVDTQTCEKWFNEIVDGCAPDDTPKFQGGRILANNCSSFSIYASTL